MLEQPDRKTFILLLVVILICGAFVAYWAYEVSKPSPVVIDQSMQIPDEVVMPPVVPSMTGHDVKG